MWARKIELITGLWLAASPTVFAGYGFESGTAGFDHSVGLLVVILAIASIWMRIGWAHLITLLVAVVLLLPSYLTPYPAPAYIQNRIVVGLLLLVLAILPDTLNEDQAHELAGETKL